MKSIKVELDSDTTTEELLSKISELNSNPEVHGILLEHPVPNQIDERLCFDAIDIKKDVEGRNIFNSNGEFPDEVVLEEEEKPKENFSLDGPCPNTNLKLKLVGTVYLSSKHAYATVREDGYQD